MFKENFPYIIHNLVCLGAQFKILPRASDLRGPALVVNRHHLQSRFEPPSNWKQQNQVQILVDPIPFQIQFVTKLVPLPLIQIDNRI